MSKQAAIVLLSGGLDSATCLALAAKQGFEVHAISFDYGQRHKAELVAAAKLAKAYAITHQTFRIDLGQVGGSALTDTNIDVPIYDKQNSHIPITYVPARNTVFLSYALAVAEVRKAKDIFIGVNAVDYSGYPDCRPEFIKAFQTMANLATKVGVEGDVLEIHTPLIALSKSEIIYLGTQHGLDYGMTVSCYQANEQGLACGVCDSCELRKAGFEDAGIPDPTHYLEA
jgi:7-cyano-7-deazaguanine synthase